MTHRALHLRALLLASGTAAAMAVALPAPAEAARAFVREIEARAAKPPVPGATLLDAKGLTACLTRARDLELTGTQLDLDGVEIDRLAAMAAMMSRGIDLGAAMSPDDDQDGSDAVSKLHKRYMDYDALAVRFQEASKAHRVKLAEYDNKVHAFDADCDKSYRPEDLTEVKRTLGWK